MKRRLLATVALLASGSDAFQIAEPRTSVSAPLHYRTSEDWVTPVLPTTSPESISHCLCRLRDLSESLSPLSETDRAEATAALEVYAPLARRLGMHRLQKELEDLSFSLLHPTEYARLASVPRPQFLGTVEGQLRELLETDPHLDDTTVTSRIKEPYSLWQKMLRRGYHQPQDVPDALAVRIVLDTHDQNLCYYVQQRLQKCLLPAHPTHPRHKDYMAHPKPNGYQSLHYTAVYEGHLVEVQVRTEAMHQTAEYGRASHWQYKKDSFVAATV